MNDGAYYWVKKDGIWYIAKYWKQYNQFSFEYPETGSLLSYHYNELEVDEREIINPNI